MRLSTRLSNHKNLSNTCASKKLFTNDAIITIVLLENYPCNTKNELKARELHYITTNNCININKPFVCDIPYGDGKAWLKEYNAINAEEIKSFKKEYYVINAEHIKSKSNEYYAKNAEHIKSKANEYYAKNSEHMKEIKKKYIESHRDQINARQKEYKASHRDQTNARQRARYAKKKLSQNVESTLNKNITV